MLFGFAKMVLGGISVGAHVRMRVRCQWYGVSCPSRADDIVIGRSLFLVLMTSLPKVTPAFSPFLRSIPMHQPPSQTSPPPFIPNAIMPRLDDNTQQTLRDAEQGIKRHTFNAWDSFSNFALRDNVLEVAVGLMYSDTLFLSCKDQKKFLPSQWPDCLRLPPSQSVCSVV